VKSTDQTILEVKHLFVTLDGKQILRDISFSLKSGEDSVDRGIAQCFALAATRCPMGGDLRIYRTTN
jgi:hypothetical protein